MKNALGTYFHYYAPLALGILLLLDMGFIILHIVVRMGPPPDNPFFLLETPRGLPEIYQYIKEVSIAIGLFVLFWRGRSRVAVYAAWGLLFAYMWLDDWIEVHELIGRNVIAPMLGVGYSSGELAAAFGFILLFGLLIWLAYRRTTDERALALSKTLLLLVIIFGIFSIVIDEAHSFAIEALASRSDTFAFKLMGLGWDILEEGGEQVTFTLLMALGVGLYQLRGIWSWSEAHTSEVVGVVTYETQPTDTFSRWLLPQRWPLRWLIAQDFLFNRRRMALVQALRSRLTPADQLIEHDKTLIVGLSAASLPNVAALTSAAQQALPAGTIHSGTAAAPADGTTLEMLTNTARQRLK